MSIFKELNDFKSKNTRHFLTHFHVTVVRLSGLGKRVLKMCFWPMQVAWKSSMNCKISEAFEKKQWKDVSRRSQQRQRKSSLKYFCYRWWFFRAQIWWIKFEFIFKNCILPLSQAKFIEPLCYELSLTQLVLWNIALFLQVFFDLLKVARVTTTISRVITKINVKMNLFKHFVYLLSNSVYTLFIFYMDFRVQPFK